LDAGLRGSEIPGPDGESMGFATVITWFAAVLLGLWLCSPPSAEAGARSCQPASLPAPARLCHPAPW